MVKIESDKETVQMSFRAATNFKRTLDIIAKHCNKTTTALIIEWLSKDLAKFLEGRTDIKTILINDGLITDNYEIIPIIKTPKSEEQK